MVKDHSSSHIPALTVVILVIGVVTIFEADGQFYDDEYDYNEGCWGLGWPCHPHASHGNECCVKCDKKNSVCCHGYGHPCATQEHCCFGLECVDRPAGAGGAAGVSKPPPAAGAGTTPSSKIPQPTPLKKICLPDANLTKPVPMPHAHFHGYYYGKKK